MMKNLSRASWHAAGAFGKQILRANLRDWRTTSVVLFTPLLMLLVFRFVDTDPTGGVPDLFVTFFPGVLTMGILFVGSPLATRIVSWRERGIFRRLACTPQPLGLLLLAMAAVSAVLGVVQALLILTLGWGFGVPLTWANVAWSLPFIALGAACFTAYGVMLAGFSRKTETVNVLYVFSLLPMTFAAPLFSPAGALPPLVAAVGEWLPPSLVATLLQATLLEGRLPDQALLVIGGLLTCIAFFSMVSMWRFRRP